jgi:hypothetical protein
MMRPMTPDDERSPDGGRGRLGGREPAQDDPAHDDDGDHDRRHGVSKRLAELAHRRRRLLGVVALLRDDEGGHRHADAHHEAWQVAAGKDGGYRLVRHPGIDHRDDRGRDDRRQDGGADGQYRREVFVVALAYHLRDQEGAEGGDIGHRRPGDPAEDHAVDDVDVGEPAAEPPDQHGREVDDGAGHAAPRGDIAGQDEERRGEQEVRVREQADEARRDDDRIQCGEERRGGERAHPERDADGHPDDDEEEEDDQ